MAVKVKLNLDVSVRIFHYARSPALANAACSSQALHDLAATELLQRGVELETKKQLLSFLDFMAREPERRSRLLAKLAIHLSKDQVAVGPCTCTAFIAEILQRCGHVASLSLDGYLFDVDVRIGAAVVGLERVKNLRIAKAGGIRHLRPVLSVLRSGCVNVEINYAPEWDYCDPDVPDDPNLSLMSCAGSLKQLTLFEPVFELDSIVYPNLITLRIDDPADVPNLRVLLRCFPNLRHLLLDNGIRAHDLEKVRMDNQSAFSRHPWAALNYLRSSVYDLYVLGISCPVRRWSTENNGGDHFATCIRSVAPIALDLIVRLGRKKSFEPIARALKGCKLSHLNLHLRFNELDLARVKESMNQLRHCIAMQKLKFLELHLSCQRPEKIAERDKFVDWLKPRCDYPALQHYLTGEEATAVYDYFHAYSKADHAATLFSLCKSLKFLFVRFYCQGPAPVKATWAYWTVDRTFPVARVIRLTSAQAEEVRVQEKMGEFGEVLPCFHHRRILTWGVLDVAEVRAL